VTIATAAKAFTVSAAALAFTGNLDDLEGASQGNRDARRTGPVPSEKTLDPTPD
jgi:hypothetical protein